MECPHCFNEFDANKYENLNNQIHITDGDSEVLVFHFECPDCHRSSIYYCIIDGQEDSGIEFPIYPRPDSRKPCPASTPQHISEDYYEACGLAQSNPTASAILSRRCLENTLLHVANTNAENLAGAIKQLKGRNELPSDLQARIDTVRRIGNLAAHGGNTISSGEVVEITYKDADTCLKILSDLLYYYYNQSVKI